MDIGTAKAFHGPAGPVAHHLLDLLSRISQVTPPVLRAPRQVLDDVRAAWKRSLIVAGSGLYLQALLYGLMPTPSLRAFCDAALHLYADQHGTPVLHSASNMLIPSRHPLIIHTIVSSYPGLRSDVLTGEPFSVHALGIRAKRHCCRMFRRRSDTGARL